MRKDRPYITKKQLQKLYPWLTEQAIKEKLPPSVAGVNPSDFRMMAWKKEDVLPLLKNSELFKDEVQAYFDKQQRIQDRQEDLKNFIISFTPEVKFEYAAQLERHFILHVGPTNSGKTYDALEALKNSGSGVYLGPLRLLALEVFDKLNESDIPCSLLTGEEAIDVPFAGITASTIEMADFRKSYDVAVIDEAQMIADPTRGGSWLDAICKIDAAEVHVCLAPEAENVVRNIISQFCNDVDIVHHDRLCPLKIVNQVKSIKEIVPGDAVIAFSRRQVLAIAGALEKAGLKPSVIYGALPPDARKSEVHKFESGENNVVVATDAIGMGVSLPIKRVVFSELTKYDGNNIRPLNNTEILQIAGRAGRYGIYDVGEVTAFHDVKKIKKALQEGGKDIEKYRVPFPVTEAIESKFSLKELFAEWQKNPKSGFDYRREDMSVPRELLALSSIKGFLSNKRIVMSLVTVPIDSKNESLLQYFDRCAAAIFSDKSIPKPTFGLYTLESCETQYKALDLYHHLCRRFNQDDQCKGKREMVLRRIAKLLAESKQGYIRKCSCCGKELPINYPYGMCQKCYNSRFDYYDYNDHWY